MTGLTDALLTMASGTHVKPNIRVQGDKARGMRAAIDAGAKIGMQAGDFETIAGQTGRTPYGTLTNFEAPGASPEPFKAVQHGQFGTFTVRPLNRK